MAAEELAQCFANDAKFKEIKLASWLVSPDGQMIECVVSALLPYPESLEFKLLVRAIEIAALGRTKEQRFLAGLGAGGLLVLLGAALFGKGKSS